MPTANITIIIGKSKRRRSFFSYAQKQGRRIRHYGLTVLICFSVAPDYAIREILPNGLCPSGAAASPLALDYCMAGISTHSPPRPACPLVCGAPRRRQASLGHGDACKGCLQGYVCKGYQQGMWPWGMPARDASRGCLQRGCQQGMRPLVCHLPMVFCPLCIRRPRADCPTRCPAAL